MKNNLKKIFIVVALLIFGSIVGVKAQETDQAATPSGLTISPIIVEPNIQPGDSYTQIVKLENPTDDTVTLYPKTSNFTAKDDSGEPIFSTDEEDNSYGLASWIEYSEEAIVLAPKSRQEFTYVINVPEDTKNGGYYGVVFFSSTPGEVTGSGVAISSQIGQLILLGFGKTTEQLTLKDFEVPFISQKTPIEMIANFTNTGNVHVKPSGTVEIKNLFGQTSGSYVLNEKKSSILPDQSRKYPVTFDKKWAFGYYKAELKATYGSSATPLTSTSSFWVLPLIPILIVLFVLILIIWLIRTSIKKHDQKIMQQNNSAPTNPAPPTTPPQV